MKLVIGIGIYLVHLYALACGEPPQVKQCEVDCCASKEPIIVNPAPVKIDSITAEIKPLPQPLQVEARIVDSEEKAIFKSVAFWALMVALLGLFISVYAAFFNRKAYLNALHKSVHDEHWFRNVVHPYCFKPCMFFLKWASQNIEQIDTENSEEVQQFESDYSIKLHRVIKSLRMVLISSNDGEIIESIEKTFILLEDRVVSEIYNIPAEDFGDEENLYLNSPFYFEDALNEIAKQFQKLQENINK